MSYEIEAFVGVPAVLAELDLGPCVDLGQGLALIPVDGHAIKAAGSPQRPSLPASFSILTVGLLERAQRASHAGKVAFVAGRFFGGKGGQSCLVWDRGKVAIGPLAVHDHDERRTTLADWPINRALRELGAKVTLHDEFDSVGLGRNRHTEHWRDEIARGGPSVRDVRPRRASALPAVSAHHFVLAVPDAEASATFFVEALGFEREPVGDPGWRFVKRDACRIMLGSCPDAIPAAKLGDHSYFGYLVVGDVDAYHAHLVARGVEVLHAPADKPWGMRELAIRTPDGHRIMLGERLA